MAHELVEFVIKLGQLIQGFEYVFGEMLIEIG